MAFFNIVLQTRASLHPDGEPSDFVSEYSGVITCTDDETGAETKVGRVSALRVHAGLACNAGEPLFDVCDSHSAELQYLHALLYEPGGYSFKEELVAAFDVTDEDLLVLDYVILNPKWRKLKLGLLAVRKLVDLLGGGIGLAVSEIAPLRASAHKPLRVPVSWPPGTRPRTCGRRPPFGCGGTSGGWGFGGWAGPRTTPCPSLKSLRPRPSCWAPTRGPFDRTSCEQESGGPFGRSEFGRPALTNGGT